MEDEIIVGLEKEKLLSIFPEEIWMTIIGYLEDDNDLEATSNASLFLRNILRNRRTLFLFQNVWNVFVSRFKVFEWTSYFRSSDPGQELAPCELCGRLRFTKPYSEVLKMRLVCLGWCQTIDSSYQLYLSRFDGDGDTGKEMGVVQWNYMYSLFWVIEPGENFQQFYRHFDQTQSSEGSERPPFLSRKLKVEIGLTGCAGQMIDNQPLFDELPNFLLNYGQHVHYFSVAMWFKVPFVETYTRLCLWLSFMPNLKTLELNILSKCGEEPYVVRRPHQSELVELSNAMSINSFPVFGALKFLKIRSCPPIIFTHFTERNGNVTMVKIFPATHPDFYDVSSVQLPLENLTHFSTTVYSETTLLQLAVPLASCPLRKLCLHVDLGEDVCIQWLRVFEMLRVCNSTLKELTLSLPENDPDASRIDNSQLRLQLHNISSLELTLPSCHSLDFILPMTETLKYLSVKVPRQEDDDRKRILAESVDGHNTIKFFTCLANPMSSNVWRLFPNMARVDYHGIISGEQEFLIWSCQRGD